MNILLVNPWITDFVAHDLWIRPLGLLYAGAFLRTRGHEVRLVDCMDRFQDSGGTGDLTAESRPFHTGKFHSEIIDTSVCYRHVPRHYRRFGIPEALFDRLVTDGPWPDAVLVTSVMTYWYPGVFHAIARIRELLPGVPVILGGVYATLCHEHAREHSGADRIVHGGSPADIIQAVEDAAGQHGNGPITPDAFAAWPEPVWDVYDRLPAAMVMTARGCPLRCTVCASRLLFDGFERREPADAAASILRLAARGVEDCAFADDALLLDAARYAIPLFERLAAEGAPVRLHSPNGLHAREVTPTVARAMKAGGMETVRLSLETASEARQRDFSSKVTREEFRRATDALFDAGYAPSKLGAYILAGLPGQTAGEAYDTAGFALECGVPVKPALFSPVPGTVEYARAVAAGMIAPGGDPLMQNNTLRTLDLWGEGLDGYGRFRKWLGKRQPPHITLP